jgi:Co/Zn/Cd efflux system component
MHDHSVLKHPELRPVLKRVAWLNGGFFGIEFTMALLIGSVALFADSIDFLEDASTNLLIILSLSWSVARRIKVGYALAGFLLFPSLAALWAAYEKFLHPIAPEAIALSITGLGALAVNVYCAWQLARFRHEKSSLTRAAYLCARNDALANIAIIATGLLTLVYVSPWPDVAVGLGIAALNGKAAWEVFELAHAERKVLNDTPGKA